MSGLFFNYQILSAKSCSSVLQSFDILKLSAQFLYTRNLERGAEFLLQNVENGGCHQIFAIFWGICRLENLQKTLLDRGNLLIKLLVALIASLWHNIAPYQGNNLPLPGTKRYVGSIFPEFLV